MEKTVKIILVTGVCIAAVVFSLQSMTPSTATVNPIRLPNFLQTPPDSILKEPTRDIDALPFQDNPEIYQSDDPASVVTIYVTVRKGNSADHTDFTWSEVNDFTKWFYTNNTVVDVGRAEAIVQFGDENGPLPGEVGYGAVSPNATIQIRGASTSMMPQKSYKIELGQGAGKWRGQSSIALNKHIFDPSRVRNKLNFDLLKQIPNMVSLRTQFVQLYVKDQTTDTWETGFADYGLYTQIELPDRRFLRAHLLDPDGQLYKTTFFEFDRYPGQIRLVDDPLFDENIFSSILEIKGNRDNAKLIQMLDDVNNLDIPIETVFEKYFDAENYLTWLAYNILVGNVDTSSQNFYLYSPHNSNTFYFIPWDYDDSFFRSSREWISDYSPYYVYEYGVANYWGTHLANRLLRLPAFRELLDAKILSLKDFLSPARIQGLLNIYNPVAERYALRMPDLQYFPTTGAGMALDFESIPLEVQKNYELYLKSLQTSMPFYLGTPVPSDGGLNFHWEDSYDFNGQDITYRFILARDWTFRDVVYEETLTNITNVRMDMLASGEYFWTVIATNESGETQLPFNSLFDADDQPHSGLKRLYITPAGEVQE